MAPVIPSPPPPPALARRAPSSRFSSSKDEVETARHCLTRVLADDDVFDKILATVFEGMDKDEDGTLDTSELERYISGHAESMGVTETPTSEQVHSIFQHLDLNCDSKVSREELAVFLKHFFQQQLKQCELTLSRMH